jgi:hypothetical protein
MGESSEPSGIALLIVWATSSGIIAFEASGLKPRPSQLPRREFLAEPVKKGGCMGSFTCVARFRAALFQNDTSRGQVRCLTPKKAKDRVDDPARSTFIQFLLEDDFLQ